MGAPLTERQRGEIEANLLLGLTDGLSRTDACAIAGISYTTLLAWIENDPSFEAYVRMAEIKCKRFHLQKIRDGDARWQASAWLLERKWWKEFGLKQQDQVDEKRAIRVRKIVTVT